MMHPIRLLQEIMVKVFEIHPKIVTIVGNIFEIRLDVPLGHGNYAGGSPVGNVMMQFRPVVSQVFDIFPEILQVKPNVAQVSKHVAIMPQIFQAQRRLEWVKAAPGFGKHAGRIVSRRASSSRAPSARRCLTRLLGVSPSTHPRVTVWRGAQDGPMPGQCVSIPVAQVSKGRRRWHGSGSRRRVKNGRAQPARRSAQRGPNSSVSREAGASRWVARRRV